MKRYFRSFVSLDPAKLKKQLSKVSYEQRIAILQLHDRSSGEWTPVKKAAFRGHTEILTALLTSLEEEDRMIVIGDCETPLHWASEEGHTETVTAILDCLTPEQQLKLFSTRDNCGGTAILWASQRGHTETVQSILNYLSPQQQLQLISAQNKYCKTPIQLAFRERHADTEGLLRECQLRAEYALNAKK